MKQKSRESGIFFYFFFAADLRPEDLTPLRDVLVLRAVDFFAVFRLDFLAADFFPADFLAVDFFGADFLAVDFFAADFFGADFFAADFFADDFFAAFFGAL